MNKERSDDETQLPSLASLSSSNQQLLLAFLDAESANSLQLAVRGVVGLDSLCVLLRTHKFVEEYLVRTDRSIYLAFYGEPAYQPIDREQLALLSARSPTVLAFLADCFDKIYSRLACHLRSFPLAQNLLQSLHDALTDPELPAPRLRKQHLGRHCNSPYQFFLVDRAESSSDEGFEGLREFTRGESVGLQGESLCVGYENYQHYLRAGELRHNLLVLILALVDLTADAYHFTVASASDSLSSFAEFCLRFGIFRNAIMGLQSQWGAVFRDQKLQLWPLALSRWFRYSQRLHDSLASTCFYLLRSLNIAELREELVQRASQNSLFIELSNRLEFAPLRNEEQCEGSPLLPFLWQDPSLASQLIREYVEYLVDISINQHLVHWCGHSQQHFRLPYKEFELSLLEHYQGYLTDLLPLASSVTQPLSAADSLACILLSQLDREYLKPPTLRKVLALTAETMQVCMGADYEHCILRVRIEELLREMGGRDKTIEHFNEERGTVVGGEGGEFNIYLEGEDRSATLKTSVSTAHTHRSERLLRSRDSLIQEDFP